MDDRLDTEIHRQISVAAAYSVDPENIQAHLDSWADRHVRARVRIIGFDATDAVDTLTLGVEMTFVEPRPRAVTSPRRAPWSDFVATWFVVAAGAGSIVLALGLCVRVARWIGWGV